MPKGIPNKRYTGEFKWEVVETMQKEKLSCREAARRFEVSDHKLVASWERIYLTEGYSGLCMDRRRRIALGAELPKGVEEDLLTEVQRLRAENAYLKKLRALVLEEESQGRKHGSSGN